MTWIRVETNIAENEKVHAFADGCGISAEEAVGFLVRVWGRVAEHRPTGDLTGVSDMVLEHWAVWRGKRGLFATQFRKWFVSNEILVGWKERQGKLVERAEKERLRKLRGSSAETPPPRKYVSSTTPEIEASGKETMTASAETPRYTGTQESELMGRLSSKAQAALPVVLRLARDREALCAELLMIGKGERGFAPSWDAVSLAVEDLRTNGVIPSARSLRTYVQSAVVSLAKSSVGRGMGDPSWDAAAQELERRRAAS